MARRGIGKSSMTSILTVYVMMCYSGSQISTIITQLFLSVETLGTLLPVTNGTATFKTDNLGIEKKMNF